MSHSLTIDSTKPFSALNERLHASTDGRFWLGRLWQTVKTSWQDQGAVKAAGVLSGYTAVKAYTCFFAYLCLEGAYRSFEEASIAYREEGHVTRELGDAGGWTSLAMFSLFALGATLTQCIREFEYDDIKRICNDWYEEVGKQEIIVDREEFYAHLCKILSNFSAQCLSQKSIVSQRLTALEIMQSLNDLNYAGDAAEGSELHLDRELKRFYLLVHAERTNKVAFANYFERLKTGLRAVKAQQGIWGQFKAISTGVACPIIFTANSLLSYIGEVPLMKQVFGQREDLLSTGHAGEWPFNGAESALAAVVLHKWACLNEGDLVLSKQVFDKQHPLIAGAKPEVIKRWRDTANSDLQYLASNCFLPKNPCDYELDPQ